MQGLITDNVAMPFLTTTHTKDKLLTVTRNGAWQKQQQQQQRQQPAAAEIADDIEPTTSETEAIAVAVSTAVGLINVGTNNEPPAKRLCWEGEARNEQLLRMPQKTTSAVTTTPAAPALAIPVAIATAVEDDEKQPNNSPESPEVGHLEGQVGYRGRVPLASPSLQRGEEAEREGVHPVQRHVPGAHGNDQKASSSSGPAAAPKASPGCSPTPTRLLCVVCEAAAKNGKVYCKSCYGVLYKHIKQIIDNIHRHGSKFDSTGPRAEVLGRLADAAGSKRNTSRQICQSRARCSPFHYHHGTNQREKCAKCRVLASIELLPELAYQLLMMHLEKAVAMAAQTCDIYRERAAAAAAGHGIAVVNHPQLQLQHAAQNGQQRDEIQRIHYQQQQQQYQHQQQLYHQQQYSQQIQYVDGQLSGLVRPAPSYYVSQPAQRQYQYLVAQPHQHAYVAVSEVQHQQQQQQQPQQPQQQQQQQACYYTMPMAAAAPPGYVMASSAPGGGGQVAHGYHHQQPQGLTAWSRGPYDPQMVYMHSPAIAHGSPPHTTGDPSLRSATQQVVYVQASISEPPGIQG